MANFTTHIAVGTVVSGAAATLTLAANVISPESLVAVTLAGVVGSILPDIDLKESRPSRALFAGLGVFASFCALFAVATRYSIAEMWLVWLATLVLVRYGLHMIFHRFSYHRGIWHSLLAGLCCWFLTTIVYHRLLGFHEGVAWLAGGFVFVGYITHLILDELYSVDVLDVRLKTSFGTALKFYDRKHVGDSAVVAALTVLAFLAAPPSKPFVEGITSHQLWAGLQQRLLPRDKWFGLIPEYRGRLWGMASPSNAPGPDRATSPIATGSVTAREHGPVALPAAPARMIPHPAPALPAK